MEAAYIVMLVLGCLVWFGAILADAFMGSNDLMAPCNTERMFSGYNYVFVAFPILVVIIAEMHIMQSLGAFGFLCLFEALCLMGVTGFEQIETLHWPMGILAGVCNTCVCLNSSVSCGLLVGAPLLLLFALMIMLMTYACKYECDAASNIACYTTWLLDFWLIMSRLLLLFMSSTDWVDHDLFDCVVSGILLCVLFAICVVVFACTARFDWRLIVGGDLNSSFKPYQTRL
jgi:hypothetical protein